MGQNREIRQNSYVKITTPLSKKEELMFHYNEVSHQELAVDKKKERSLFIYQFALVASLIILAFLKEKFYPGHVEWVNWIMQKIQSI